MFRAIVYNTGMNIVSTKNSFFLSDTHYGHSNIVKYSKRPFASDREIAEDVIDKETIDAHDECLIANWNAMVKQGDDVYFLGDFAFKNVEKAASIRRRLNGTIFFIEGNHDQAAFKIRDRFAWYDSVKKVRVNDKEFFLSHYAHRVWLKSHHGCIHLYGHSHNSLPDDPNALSMDVGIDATAARLSGWPTGKTPPYGATKREDYRPISFDEVMQFMAKKDWKPIDHHGAREGEVGATGRSD